MINNSWLPAHLQRDQHHTVESCVLSKDITVICLHFVMLSSCGLLLHLRHWFLKEGGSLIRKGELMDPLFNPNSAYQQTSVYEYMGDNFETCYSKLSVALRSADKL